MRSEIAYQRRLLQMIGRPLEGHIGTSLSLLDRRALPFGEFGHPIQLSDAGIGLSLFLLELQLDIYNIVNSSWYDGEFCHASNFSQGQATDLIPARHVTVGTPRTLCISFSVHL
ncbi:hypothetical protein [Pajaroellobacter abortibovis]|uniref:TonB-dependent receptor-like beta-barrel domain-containing protein n=1 Tax=Pajaroellobacter abortibovis TaxID=1882918 RepID=A0A1L6MYX5_9BACT|nr:hypothetical protein [Pajaroellobacter abortibovis]APS00667.1 hypothetical protein BCY86_08260 [Pajaroellobacter abortibovis]